MRKVFVVVLNWNRKDETLECLKSIGELRIRNYELGIIVVDNASTDGSAEALAGYQLIRNKKNLGFTGGNNVGMRYALENGANFVMVLNNDTVVDKDLVINLLSAADGHKDAGIFSPKIYFAKGFEFHKDRYSKKDLGEVIWYAGGIFDWDNVLGSNRGVDEVDIDQYNIVSDTDFATGACMLVRREVLEKVGLFDEKYFMYLEDVDLSLRIKKAGWRVLYAPDGFLWHKVARSSGIGSELNDYYFTRNRLLFGMRYAPLRAKLALLRESFKFLLSGRKWQKQGAKDFYLGKFGKGGFK